MSAVDAASAPRRRPGLHRWLLLAAALALLPVALLAVATFLQAARAHEAQVLSSARATARSLSAAVDAELDQSLAALSSLAGSRRLAAGELAAFHAEAVDLVRRRPAWSNVVLSSPEAQQSVNTLLPFGATLPSRVTPGVVAEVAATGRPRVGDIVFSRFLQAYAFAVYQPVVRDEEVVGVLSAIVRPASILDVVLRHDLPQAGVAGVYDRQGLAVARSVDPVGTLGQPAATPLRERLEQSKSEPVLLTTREGVRSYAVLQRSRRTGWTVVLGLPADAVDGTSAKASAIFGGALLATVAAGLYAAHRAGRQISADVATLEAAARAVAHGAPMGSASTATRQATQVLAALSDAGLRQQQLTREREACERGRDADHAAAAAAHRRTDELLALAGTALRQPLSVLLLDADRDARHGSAPDAPAAASEAAHVPRLSVLARRTRDLLAGATALAARDPAPRQAVELADAIRRASAGVAEQCELGAPTLSLATVWIEAGLPHVERIVANALRAAIGAAAQPRPSLEVSLARLTTDAVLQVRASHAGDRPIDIGALQRGVEFNLVRLLVEHHGGRVEARAAPDGAGVDIVLAFPALGEPPPAARTLAAATDADAGDPAGDSAGPRRIAIVVAAPDLRTSLHGFFAREGHEVHEADTARSGIQLIARGAVDIAFVDLALGTPGGYVVAQAIRERTPSRVRLVALSTCDSPAAQVRSVRAGFDVHLVQPLLPGELRDAVAPARGLQR